MKFAIAVAFLVGLFLSGYLLGRWEEKDSTNPKRKIP